MLRATSTAPVADTLIASLVSSTTLFPDNNSKDERAGTGYSGICFDFKCVCHNKSPLTQSDG